MSNSYLKETGRNRKKMFDSRATTVPAEANPRECRWAAKAGSSK